jgi:hypothetical protein
MAEELSAYQEGFCSMELSSYRIHVKIKSNVLFHDVSRLQHQVWQRVTNKAAMELSLVLPVVCFSFDVAVRDPRCNRLDTNEQYQLIYFYHS